MKSNEFKQKSLLWLVLALLAVGPAWSGSGGTCVSAEIPWQMEMPDGSVHEPGTIKLCHVQDYNPVSGLHSLQVDGMPLGMFQSTIAHSEEQASIHPILVLKSDGNNHVRLVAYAWPRERSMEVYWLHRPGENLGQVRQASIPLRALQREQEYYVVAASRGY